MGAELLIQSIIDLISKYAFVIGNIWFIEVAYSSILKPIQLHRLSPYDGKIIADKNFVFSKTGFLDKKLIDFRKKQVLKPYVLELRYHVLEDDLKIISNNIATLDIKRDFLLLPRGISGRYEPEKNRLTFALKEAFGHEFLHAASTVYDEKSDITLSGFAQKKGLTIVGTGLTEGYTELLATRLYHKKKKATSYKELVKFAEMLEFFFKNPKEMSHLYFGCNLPGFIEHFEQYASKEEITNLIIEMDQFKMAPPLSPITLVKSVQIQMKLYNWFKSSCTDIEKLRKFEQLACKNKIVSFLIRKKKLKLSRKPPFDLKKTAVVQIQKVSSDMESRQKTITSDPSNPPLQTDKKWNLDDILSTEEQSALEEMLKTTDMDSLRQRSILEEAKAMLIKQTEQVEAASIVQKK